MKKIFPIIIAVGILCSIFPVHVQADIAQTSDQVAVALVIDSSGSMNRSDPDQQRFAATEMVLDLLASTDYVSITTFSDEATDLLSMADLTETTSKQTKAQLQNMPLAEGYTDYQKALARAVENLQKVPVQDIRKFITFLTDGRPEVRDKTIDMVRYLDELNLQIDGIGREGYPIYTVGFGDTDQTLLESMSGKSRGASLVGTSNVVGDRFFEILRQLKNRYVPLDEESASGERSYELTVDEYTSRITILVEDTTGSGSIGLVSREGISVEPILERGALKVFHLNEDPQGRTVVYDLAGRWSGKVKAVRDTKTKLWIVSPENNAQIPFEEDIIAQVIQTGVLSEGADVRVQLLQGGKVLRQPVEVESAEEQYQITVGRLPQTGEYDLEASLYNGERLIAKTTSSFQVKNLPTLRTSLSDEITWIQGEPSLVTASLQRSGRPVIDIQEKFEITLQITQNQFKEYVTLKDDGDLTSGDIIAGDGVYSANVILPNVEMAQINVTAQGRYLNESFLLTGESLEADVHAPGTIDATIPESILRNGSVQAEIQFQLRNGGTYPEQVTTFIQGKQHGQPIVIAAGAEVTNRVVIPATAELADVSVEMVPKYSVTRLVQDRDRIRILAPEVAETSASRQWLIILGGIGALLLVALILIRRKPLKVERMHLKGRLHYTDGQDNNGTIQLSGKQPMEISIGGAQPAGQHIPAAVKPGFMVRIHPLYSERDGAVVELKCLPPGTLIKDEALMTSILLSPGDFFDMAGLKFTYELDQADTEGRNVLAGRV